MLTELAIQVLLNLPKTMFNRNQFYCHFRMCINNSAIRIVRGQQEVGGTSLLSTHTSVITHIYLYVIQK